MARQIRLNAFDMNCVGHIQHGMWTHPRDQSTDYNTLEYWQQLARTAEQGWFDGNFLADIVGVYDVYKHGPEPSILNGVQIPVGSTLPVFRNSPVWNQMREPGLRDEPVASVSSSG